MSRVAFGTAVCIWYTCSFNNFTGVAYGWRVGSKLDEMSYVCEISQTEAYKLTLEKRGFGENTLISKNACTLQIWGGRQCCRHNVEDIDL